MALQLSEASGGNFCLTKAGLAIATTTSRVKTAAAAATVIDGKHQASYAATDNIVWAAATGYTLPNIPAGYKAAIGIWFDGTNVKHTMGVASQFAATSDKVAPPPFPGGVAPLGVVTVANGSAADFVVGTTALNAAGITATYSDYATIPGAGLA